MRWYVHCALALCLIALGTLSADEQQCAPNQWPDVLENVDGSLELKCHKPRLDDCPEELAPSPVDIMGDFKRT